MIIFSCCFFWTKGQLLWRKYFLNLFKISKRINLSNICESIPQNRKKKADFKIGEFAIFLKPLLEFSPSVVLYVCVAERDFFCRLHNNKKISNIYIYLFTCLDLKSLRWRDLKLLLLQLQSIPSDLRTRWPRLYR